MAASILAFYPNSEFSPRVSFEKPRPVTRFKAWKAKRRSAVDSTQTFRITRALVASLANHRGYFQSEEDSFRLDYRIIGTPDRFRLILYGLDWAADVQGTADGFVCQCGATMDAISWRPGKGVLCKHAS